MPPPRSPASVALRGLALAGIVLALLAPTAAALPALPGAAHGPTAGPGARPTVAFTSPAVGSAFWPTYLQNPGRTGANPFEVTLAPGNASGLRPLWTARTGGVIEDSPVVAGGSVYVSAWNGYEYAFNLTSGALRWSTFVGQTTFSQCNYAAARGTTSSADVEGGTVYVLGGDPYLYALDASNGSIAWKTSLKVNSPSAGDYNWGSPLVANGSAYVGLSTACGAPGSQGMVVQVNLSGNHSVLHTFAVVPTGQSGGSVWTTSAADPAAGLVWVTTGDLYSATSGYGQSILALRASNLSLVGHWQMPTGGGDFDFGAGPTLFHDASGRALVGALNKNGVFYALNRSNVTGGATWRPVWTDNVSWYFNTSAGSAACGCSIAPAAFDGATLYVGGGFTRFPNGTEAAGSVRAIDPATGGYRWSVPTGGIVRAGLAYANGLVVDAPARNDNLTGWVEVRSAADGSLLFSVPTNRTVDGPPSIADGILLFGIGNLSLGGPGYLRAFALPLAVPGPAITPAASPATASFVDRPTGGVPPYAFAWSFGDGSSSSAGSGTHAFPGPGTYLVTLTASDATGANATVVANVTLPDPPIGIGSFTASPPALVLGNSTQIAVLASGGFGALAYAFQGLPAGCPPVGAPIFDCTPSATGTFHPVVVVSDGYGGSASSNLTLTVLVPPAAPPVITALRASPAAVPVGTELNLSLTVAGGLPPLAYRYNGLPPGCASADRATLTCAPTGVGTFPIGANVTDAEGRSDSAQVTVLVEPVSPRATATLILQQFLVSPSTAHVGTSVEFVTVVSGGTGPYLYAYGGLPSGCPALDAANLTCYPSSAGSFHVGLEVKDASGQSVFGNLTLTVAAAPGPAAPAAGPPLAVVALTGGLAAVAAALSFLVLRGKRATRTQPPPPR